MRVLDAPGFADTSQPEVVRYLRQRHRQRARRWANQEARRSMHPPEHRGHDGVAAAPSHDRDALDERRAAEYRRVRNAMIAAEEKALLDLRAREVIGDDVMRRVLRELDLERILLESREPVVEPSTEVRIEEPGRPKA